MSSGSPILLKIVSENRFSGKTYFYTIASRLLNVHPTDAGVYVCTAENDAGSVEASTWVSVSEPPVSLINLILLMFIKSFISFSPY